MHEMAICRAIAAAAAAHAGGHPVTRVEVRIGHLRQVVPDALDLNWRLLTDTVDELTGAELVVDHVPAVLRCDRCGHQTRLDLPVMMCEACASTDTTALSGEELDVVSLDRVLEEPA